MKHKSILEAVEWHLNKKGSITQLQCLDRYGSWRLSQVTNVSKYILIK